MGFRTCRNLSVLLLAGVALIGCNNTPDKPKQFGSGQNFPPANLPSAQNQQLQGNTQQFPKASPLNTAGGSLQPNAFPSTLPNGPAPSKNFGPAPGLSNDPVIPSGIGAPPSTFPPLPRTGDLGTAPSQTGFGTQRNTAPPMPDGFGGPITPPTPPGSVGSIPQAPQGFPGGSRP